ncbi:hypothetical protein J5N97_003723 [Dioscorea zingiberensis]|uniref:Zinc finger CCCH domain-containing protein 53-like n=1 Tax=Dioscorea zingiberensis TaxID=325984 RepID=A0A9D5HRG8_9LILI|nr:hypothetical protein J5N97_003723 [Dioscorea zingiberensis]
MDSYETTRVVLSRIQALDPDNASKIMGLILIQDHGEKEMIRLAFGPESLLHSVVLKARNELGIITSSSSPSLSPLLLARQNSASRLISPPPPLAVSSPSWAPPTSPFSLANGSSSADELHSPDDIKNQTPFYGGGGGGDLVDEFQLPEQLSFLNEQNSSMLGGPKSSDLFYGDLVAGVCPSPSVGGDGLFPYSTGWSGHGNHHRRGCSVADLCLGSEGFGWKPCLYFARGYCKNGTSCRFLHGIPDDAAVKMESPAAEQQCHELLMRSKSQRASQLMASAFPYSPTGSPVSPSPSKCMSFFMQHQSSESQRAAAEAALILGEEQHKYMGRARIESLVNPGSRQIYLTFPADSTFREEDVSNYFSIYGPVQDVRIPYQQKRMFGFVTFVYPETVKLILAKGNPHFVCDARVLVKPYKEKGKVPDKYRKERTDFSGCSTPTGLDSRDQYDLQQLVSTGAARILYSSSTQEALIRRRIEEQQQAVELQKAIELQGRRFMGLQLLDLKSRSFSSHLNPPSVPSPTIPANQEEAPPPEPQEKNVEQHSQQVEKVESGGEVSPNEDCDFQESSDEHNLPDNPFASPTNLVSFQFPEFLLAMEQWECEQKRKLGDT